MNKEIIDQTLKEHLEVVERFRQECQDQIAAIAERCITTIADGGKIIFFGNGGSAADAQHLAAELVVRFARNRRPYPALALTTDTSVLTACANDFGYMQVFSRQIEALCNAGDVAIGITTSGKSSNVINGLEFAIDIGATTVAFTGHDPPPRCKHFSNLLLTVPSSITARIQECHLLAGHIICDLIETHFTETEKP